MPEQSVEGQSSQKSKPKSSHSIVGKRPAQSKPANYSFHPSVPVTCPFKVRLERLRAERNDLCCRFLKKEIQIPDFCIGLDLIGKKLVDNCLIANS